jgi:hypothetical protein
VLRKVVQFRLWLCYLILEQDSVHTETLMSCSLFPSLDVREWTCPHCGTYHDCTKPSAGGNGEGNAAQNIRTEGIRMLKADGSAVSALGGEVRPKMGRKSHWRYWPVSTEAPTIASA